VWLYWLQGPKGISHAAAQRRNEDPLRRRAAAWEIFFEL